MTEELGVDSRQRKKIFLFPKTFRPALGPTQPPIQWVVEAVSPGITQQRREADHSSPFHAEVKNGGTIP
jgi:hypothetical protein